MPVLGTQGMDYNVDITMCVDATGSMSPIISEVKRNALSFYQQFVDEMKAAGKEVKQLRIKVIVFRDYQTDSEPMTQSKFFELPQETDEFYDFVSGIIATGGGDGPENSLEALAYAMKSDWVKTGAVRRHVILLYTDAPALELGARKGEVGYPTDLPKNLAELQELWASQDMEARAKRLHIFAPHAEPWITINDQWEKTFFVESMAGCGCDSTDIHESIQILVKSI